MHQRGAAILAATAIQTWMDRINGMGESWRRTAGPYSSPSLHRGVIGMGVGHTYPLAPSLQGRGMVALTPALSQGERGGFRLSRE